MPAEQDDFGSPTDQATPAPAPAAPPAAVTAPPARQAAPTDAPNSTVHPATEPAKTVLPPVVTVPASQESEYDWDLPDDPLAALDASLTGSESPPVTTSPAKPAAAAIPPPVAPPAAPAHLPSLVRYAERLTGLEPAVINQMTGPELDRAITIGERTAARYEQQLAQRGPAKTEPVVPAEPEIDLGIDAEALADIDPGIVKALKHLGKSQTDKIAKLEAELGGFRQREVERGNAEIRQQMDLHFDSLAPTYGDTFGTGDSWKSNPAQGTNRAEVGVVMQGLANAMQGMGRPVPSLKILLDMAARSIHGGTAAPAPAPAPAPKPTQAADTAAILAKRTEEWANGTLARPAGRTENLPKGEQRALRAANEKLREQAAVNSANGVDVADDFLP